MSHARTHRCFDCGGQWRWTQSAYDHKPDCPRLAPCPGCGYRPNPNTGTVIHSETCPLLRTFAKDATEEQRRNATDTCDDCDEPRHDGYHCRDPFKCGCDSRACENARRRLLAIPGIKPKEEDPL